MAACHPVSLGDAPKRGPAALARDAMYTLMNVEAQDSSFRKL